jgi:predicted secreted protein
MNFSLFPQTRTVVEDQLIFSALNKFKDRANLVKENLNASGYRIVDISIHTSGGAPRPVPMMRARAAQMESVAAPAVSGGETNVKVTVSGVIELE